MRRIQVNALVDVIALLVFIPSLVSGMFLYLVLPSGTQGGAAFLGITRNQWLNMHDFTSMAFAALIILHSALQTFQDIQTGFTQGTGSSTGTSRSVSGQRRSARTINDGSPVYSGEWRRYREHARRNSQIDTGGYS